MDSLKGQCMRLSQRQAGGRRLLLVEEDPHVIDDLRQLFASRMFECEVALNVETARDILEERRMDAAVVDTETVSGDDDKMRSLLEEMKKIDEEMRIVVFNGSNDKQTQREMRRKGAEGYLSVKSDLNAVARSVRRVLDMKS
ncbi:MAG: response regulator [Candidatus Brocadiia bacterium]